MADVMLFSYALANLMASPLPTWSHVMAIVIAVASVFVDALHFRARSRVERGPNAD